MDPTSRLLELIGLLQARPTWSAEELAERLGVTPRSVRRDIARLRDLGYAVDATSGPYGGYRLARGQALPPLVLTDDEAVSVAVGLRTAAVSGVVGLDEAAVTALTKLEEALPSRLRERVQALAADTVHLARHHVPAVDPEVLAVLALACRRSERVHIVYIDAAGQQTRRDVDPHRVVHTGNRWYFVARDVRREAWRTFRVDRVREPFLTGVRVRLVDPPDAAALVSEAVATGPYHRWQIRVRLDLPYDVARRAVSPTTGLLEADGEATILRMGADHLRWASHYLVGLGCPFEVLEPRDLAIDLAELGRELTGMPMPPA